ncbi:molecular chaperone DnaJ [Methylomonas methanica]|uniref:Molecular chaperone DnaJ n=2 Tax=Methylomonas TaxID=416 RepID=A0A126T5S7_9GAMM|nr:molecular chaperone DnaJ [Methylomonas denitrificans]OAH97192.1 molecular chaperone DnaJ [Methylomonas methanica]
MKTRRYPLDDKSADDDEWVIWNGTLGLVTTVAIQRVEESASGRSAWLDEPFDMVGPFSFDELKTHGRISYAACIVMSRQRWQDDQVELRRESLKIRRATEQHINEKFERLYGGDRRYQVKHKPVNERQHRETLNLPIDGTLESSQIKAAFRRLAQKAHPDAGGSNEQFIRITEARNVLLKYVS